MELRTDFGKSESIANAATSRKSNEMKRQFRLSFSLRIRKLIFSGGSIYACFRGNFGARI
jgi:hypothetical protein